MTSGRLCDLGIATTSPLGELIGNGPRCRHPQQHWLWAGSTWKLRSEMRGQQSGSSATAVKSLVLELGSDLVLCPVPMPRNPG